MGLRHSADRVSPGWLRGAVGSRLTWAIYLPIDAACDAVVRGVKARFPGYGQDDALAYVGADRGIRRAPNEPAARYVVRLQQWWETWKRAGSARSVLEQLWTYIGGDSTKAVRTWSNSGARDTVNTLGFQHVLFSPAWDWDGNVAAWSRFWTVVYPGALWSAGPTWGSASLWGGAWGGAGAGQQDRGGYTWGSTAKRDEVLAVQALVQRWKAAHAKSVAIIVSVDGAGFSATTGAGAPDGTWGAWSKNSGGTQVASRPANGRYWDGAPSV